MAEAIDITVTTNGSTWRTSKAQGKTGTSVISAEAAATSLGKKLLGRRFVCAQQVIDDSLPRGKTRWQLVSKGDMA